MRVKDTIPLRLPVETSETPPHPHGGGGWGYPSPLTCRRFPVGWRGIYDGEPGFRELSYRGCRGDPPQADHPPPPPPDFFELPRLPPTPIGGVGVPIPLSDTCGACISHGVSDGEEVFGLCGKQGERGDAPTKVLGGRGTTPPPEAYPPCPLPKILETGG